MKRSKCEIIESILEICREPSGKTKIIYQANLNSIKANRIISLLIESGILEASDTTPIHYKITPTGLDFLEDIKSINVQIGNSKH